MKKSLLATVAAVALIAGAGFASAESMKEQPGAKAPAAATQKAEPEMKRGADIKAGAAVKGKAETTGAGAGAEPTARGEDSRSGPRPDSNDVKRDVAPKAQTGTKPSTSGQASEQKAAPAAKSAADQKTNPASKSSAEEKSAPAKSNAEAAPAAKSTAQTNPAGAQTGASVNLTSDQKTKIRTTVIQSSSAPKVSRSSINFNISVGTVVPRSVHFVTVPQTIVEYYPAYRGYSYFIVDDEIIIVDARTLKIIAVLAV